MKSINDEIENFTKEGIIGKSQERWFYFELFIGASVIFSIVIVNILLFKAEEFVLNRVHRFSPISSAGVPNLIF